MEKRNEFEVNCVGTTTQVINILQKYEDHFQVVALESKRNPFGDDEAEISLSIFLYVDDEGMITEYITSEESTEYELRYRPEDMHCSEVINCRKSLVSGRCDQHFMKLADEAGYNITHPITSEQFPDHVYGYIKPLQWAED